MLAQLSASTAVPKTLNAAHLLVLMPKTRPCRAMRRIANCWLPC